MTSRSPGFASLAGMARVARLPHYGPLVVAMVLVGFREGVAGPYVTLFAVERAHLAPLALGAFLTIRALGGVLISMAFGSWFDRSPSLTPLVVSLVLGAVGYALLATTTNYLFLLLIALLPLGASSASFPQLFAIARGHLDSTDRNTAEQGIALMRASFSGAWGIAPALGALIVGFFDYPGLFLASALAGLLALAGVLWTGVHAPARSQIREAQTGGTNVAVGAAATSFTLFYMATFMGGVALPIVVTQDLHGITSDVGLMYSLCALLEVPVMVAVALYPKLLGGYRGIVVGFLALLLYFLLASWAPSVGVVFLAQVARAVAFGLVGCVGISYLQDLMPDRAGAAAALYSNTAQVGSLLAGLGAGSWANQFGYRSMFLACAAQSVAGLACLSLGSHPTRRGRALDA